LPIFVQVAIYGNPTFFGTEEVIHIIPNKKVTFFSTKCSLYHKDVQVYNEITAVTNTHSVNFINILCTNFPYKYDILAAFPSYIYVEKAAETTFVQKTREYNVDDIDTWTILYHSLLPNFTINYVFWTFRFLQMISNVLNIPKG